MKIRKLILKNFRGHIDSVIDFDPSFNAIIGRNDVGKSSILDALDIFLEGGTVKMDILDCSVHADKKEVTIGLVIETERSREYLLDEKVKVTLEQESLLNGEGFLEIHKVWDCSAKSITAKSMSIYLNAFYFSEFKDDPIICKKNADLKKLLKERGLQCADEKVNSYIRKSIYDDISGGVKEEMLIHLDKEDAKKTWEKIKEELPMFFLFQSDRANKDSDKEVQDPLKAITKNAISQVEDELESVKSQVEANIKQLANQTLEKLKQMAPEIADKLTPNVSHKAWDSLFNFSFDGDDNIPINKRGSGVRRLILLNYFRAEADRKNTDGRNTIYAIEEPETSQHPDYQIMLINALLKLGENERNQVIITTHTPEFAKLCYKESLIHLTLKDSGVQIDNSDEKLKNIVKTLGILPYVCKFSVYVEGVNDIHFLKEIGKNIPELKEIFNFEDHEDVLILPFFGGNLKNWVDREYIKDSNIKALYLLDRDNEGNKDKAKDINTPNEVVITKLLMMENYFSPSLIKSAFDITFSDEEEQNWREQNIVSLIAKNKDICDKDAKNKINKELSSKVTKQHLSEIGDDVWEEVKSWFERIRDMYKSL